jgi:hypothetical protein
MKKIIFGLALTVSVGSFSGCVALPYLIPAAASAINLAVGQHERNKMLNVLQDNNDKMDKMMKAMEAMEEKADHSAVEGQKRLSHDDSGDSGNFDYVTYEGYEN